MAVLVVLVEILLECGERSYWNETYDRRTSGGMGWRLVGGSMGGRIGDKLERDWKGRMDHWKEHGRRH